MYGKLIDGALEVAPKNYIDENNTILNFDLNEELMKEYGYKLVIEAVKPDYPYNLSYEETEDEIIEIVTPNMEEAKQEKTFENNQKADEARYNQEFTLTIQEQECVFDTSEKTQSDLNTAANFCMATGDTYDGWVTNNGVELDLSLNDVATIAQEFKAKANVYTKWNEYRQAIEDAETIEELEAIVIDYSEEQTSDIEVIIDNDEMDNE